MEKAVVAEEKKEDAAPRKVVGSFVNWYVIVREVWYASTARALTCR